MAFPIDLWVPELLVVPPAALPTVAAVGATVGAPVRGAMAAVVGVGAMGLAAGTEVDM